MITKPWDYLLSDLESAGILSAPYKDRKLRKYKYWKIGGVYNWLWYVWRSYDYAVWYFLNVAEIDALIVIASFKELNSMITKEKI